MTRYLTLWGGLVLSAALVSPSYSADKIKLGMITKFPVEFFFTLEKGAKDAAAKDGNIELITGQGASGTDIEGQIALIESMMSQGVKGIAITRCTSADVVRHPLVARMVDAYDAPRRAAPKRV